MTSLLWIKKLRRHAIVVVSALSLMSACAPTREYAVLDVQATKLDIVDVGEIPEWLLGDVGGGVEVVLTSSESDPLGDSPEMTPVSQMDGARRALKWRGIDHCPGKVLYSSFKRFDSTGTYLLGYCHHVRSADDQRFLIFQATGHEGNGSQEIPAALPIAETVSFTAHDSSERFLMEFGSLYNGLYWWSPISGAKPVEGVVKTSTGEFELADAFTYLSQDGYAGTGNAKSPDWSPDGSRIAFFASNVTGLEGQDRLAQPWDLCLLDVSANSIVCPLSGLRDVGRLSWAPDGQAIAFSGGFGQGVEQGLWIYSPAQDKLALVHDDFVEEMAWTADGSRIYAVAVTLDAAMDWSLWSFDLLP